MADHGNLNRAVLLANRRSRRGREWFASAKHHLEDQGVELAYAHAFRSVTEMTGMARDAVVEGIGKVIVGGGDGTFSAVSGILADMDTVLGVLPLGTGNAFARDLGIPSDVQEACRIIAKGVVRRVDIGVLDANTFVNVATIGLTNEIAEAITNDGKRRFGRLIYAYAVLRGIRRVQPFRVRIESENGVREFETLQLVLGNGRFHAGPFLLSPDARINEGRLSLYALQTSSKRAFLRLALKLPMGQQGSLPEVHSEETAVGRITTWPAQPVTVDGESCAMTPSEYSVKARSLRVMVDSGTEL